MIVCRKCSRRHPDGTTFCVCGAFLEFDGERVADPVPAATPAPPPPAGPPPGEPIERVEQAGAAQGVKAPVPAEPAPWSGLPGESNWADPADTATSVSARLPDQPESVRTTDPVVVQPTGRAGDLICRNCGTSNAPDRQFCQHCGRPLAAAAATAAVVTTGAKRPSWWRRLAGRAPSEVRTTDPRRLAGMARGVQGGRLPGLSGRALAFRTGGIAVVLLGLLAFLGPWRGTVIGWSRDRLGASRYTVVDVDADNLSVVATDAAAAPVEFPLQQADRVVDSYSNTAWATHWLDINDPGPETPPEAGAACPSPARTDSMLRIELDEPTDLARIRILGGRFSGDETRTAYLRPRLLEVRVNDEDSCRYLTLADDGELAIHRFEHDDVEQLELRVIGVYADSESEPTLEISEIVLERRR